MLIAFHQSFSKLALLGEDVLRFLSLKEQTVTVDFVGLGSRVDRQRSTVVIKFSLSRRRSACFQMWRRGLETFVCKIWNGTLEYTSIVPLENDNRRWVKDKFSWNRSRPFSVVKAITGVKLSRCIYNCLVTLRSASHAVNLWCCLQQCVAML